MDTARFGVLTAPPGFWLNLYLYVGGSGIGFSINYFLHSLALSFTLNIYTHKRIYHLFLHFPATFPYHLPATLFRTTLSPSLFFQHVYCLKSALNRALGFGNLYFGGKGGGGCGKVYERWMGTRMGRIDAHAGLWMGFTEMFSARIFFLHLILISRFLSS